MLADLLEGLGLHDAVQERVAGTVAVTIILALEIESDVRFWQTLKILSKCMKYILLVAIYVL